MELPEKVCSAFSLKLKEELPWWRNDEYFCIKLKRLELFDTIVMKAK
jgi:hypothetical protein